MAGIVLYFIFGNANQGQELREEFILELKKNEREIDNCSDYEELHELLQPMYGIMDKIEMVDITKNNKISKYVSYIKSLDSYKGLKDKLYDEYVLDPEKDDILLKNSVGEILKSELFISTRSSIKTYILSLLNDDIYYEMK